MRYWINEKIDSDWLLKTSVVVLQVPKHLYLDSDSLEISQEHRLRDAFLAKSLMTFSWLHWLLFILNCYWKFHDVTCDQNGAYQKISGFLISEALFIQFTLYLSIVKFHKNNMQKYMIETDCSTILSLE